MAGPAVTFSNVNDPNATFTAPEGLVNTSVTFDLQVSNGVLTSIDTYQATTSSALTTIGVKGGRFATELNRGS